MNVELKCVWKRFRKEKRQLQTFTIPKSQSLYLKHAIHSFVLAFVVSQDKSMSHDQTKNTKEYNMKNDIWVFPKWSMYNFHWIQQILGNW